MKKKNKIIILSVIVVIIILGFLFMLKSQQKKSETQNSVTNEMDNQEKSLINQIKNQINATASADIYQIEEEYDGRQILQIKPNIQFETVLAGILKEGQPQENEIQELLKDKPNQNGIWISEASRDKFLNLLKENNIDSYTINKEGYLQENGKEENTEEVKILNTAIHSEKLYLLDMSGTSYTRDEFTGEIVEYPFEKMEPYQVIDAYEGNNSKILEITTNEKGKLSKQEILNEILLNLK